MGRYVITVRKGNRILQRHFFSDYYAAMDMMDFIEERKDSLYAIGSIVEFRDTDPFARG